VIVEQIRYFLACGGDVTLLDLDVALAVGQRDFLVSVGTPAARHLRALKGVTVVLDSGAWPPNNPSRPPFEAWWQELRRWREGRDDYGNLAYAIAYDTIGDTHATARDYRTTIGRIFSRAPDAPIVPVLGFGQAPEAISIAMTEGWEGVRPDLIGGGGLFVRPAYALGGLVPQRGSAEAVAWVQHVGKEMARLVADGWAEDALGVHLLGSTRRAYVGAFVEAGIPVWCDTSTPIRQAMAGEKALSWGYTSAFGLPRDLLRRSRYARVAFWLCRERARLGLPWTTPDPHWLKDLPRHTPIVKPQQHLLSAA
jgi:hypothetical protein